MLLMSTMTTNDMLLTPMQHTAQPNLTPAPQAEGDGI